ncbi:sialoadhesin-like [Chanos chanos]|uniref:Sialoadhesin-like n=1 Tax=Chanos chanos TaxID=29144 RepID=A0A6J2W3V2_CHACN|nr:sialoadhesin-like [Chanos chanos]
MTSDLTQRVNTDDQGNDHYANVQFSRSKREEVSLYSNRAHHQQPGKQEEDVQLAPVNISQASAATQGWAHERATPRGSFGLSLAGPLGMSGHNALTYELPYQAWLQKGAPVSLFQASLKDHRSLRTLDSIHMETQLQIREVTLENNYVMSRLSQPHIFRVVGQSVTLPQKNICALKGTDVDIPCTYTVNGYTVQSKGWYRTQTSGGWGRDLKTDPEYKTRVEYDDHSCGLRIKSLRLSDSGVYNFRFKTWNSDWISDPSGVKLSVTGIEKRCWSVTYNHENICALRGSSVDLSCSYTYPAWHTVTTTLWFNKWQYWVEPTDLSLDEDYEGRVEFRGDKKSDCTLRIRDLRESDARNYKFRFLTNQEGGKYSGANGVSLSITDLKVDIQYGSRKQSATLTCKTSCSLSNNPTFIWYKNGQPLPDRYTQRTDLYYVNSVDDGSYSCAVKGFEGLRSPAVCFLQQKCWSVAYTKSNICGLIGSSVDIQSHFTYPDYYKVTKTTWYIRRNPNPKELSQNEEKDHMKFICTDHSCLLRVTQLRMTDSAEYFFRFETSPSTYYNSTSGVILTVTDLQVTVSPDTVREGQRVTLTCYTTCTLSNNPTYIWYRNNQPVTNKHTNILYLDSVSSEDADNYSCAVRGQENLRSPAVYSPKNTRVSVSPSGQVVEGSSVTLTCSSDANPPVHTYTWYKKDNGAEPSLMGSGQNYSITNISSEDSGQYYCRAENRIGNSSSTEIHLNVTCEYIRILTDPQK